MEVIHLDESDENRGVEMESRFKRLKRRFPGEAFTSLGIDVGEGQIDFSLGDEIKTFSFFDEIAKQRMIAFTAALLIRGMRIAEEDA